MFVNLIASCLLATAVASPKPLYNSGNVSVDHTAVVSNGDGYNSNTARGYVLRYYDSLDTPYFTESLFNYDVSLIIEINEYDYSPVFASYFGSLTSYEYELCICRSFSITYDYSDDIITFSYTCATSLASTTSDYTFTYNFNINDTLQDMCDYFESYSPLFIGISFIDPYQMSADQMKLFNTIFTSNINDNFVYYNGWYNVQLNYIQDGRLDISLPGLFYFDNGKFNFFDYQYIRNSGTFINNIYLIDYRANYAKWTYNVYSSSEGWTENTHNINFGNVFMSTSTYSKLDIVGDFQFVPVENGNTWTDLFTSIADTPIIMVTSMFSFDLFGVPFYSAFFGIITLIAMFFILKKVL